MFSDQMQQILIQSLALANYIHVHVQHNEIENPVYVSVGQIFTGDKPILIII